MHSNNNYWHQTMICVANKPVSYPLLRYGSHTTKNSARVWFHNINKQKNYNEIATLR